MVGGGGQKKEQRRLCVVGEVVEDIFMFIFGKQREICRHSTSGKTFDSKRLIKWFEMRDMNLREG